MRSRGYPLNVMHGYTIPAAEALALGAVVERADADALGAISSVASARRPLLAYGAAVLEEVIRLGRPTRGRHLGHGGAGRAALREARCRATS